MSRSIYLAALLALTLTLSACTVGPNFQRPDSSAITPAKWRAGTGKTLEKPADLAKWWRKLDDPILNQLIDDAVTGNRDVKIAEARIRQTIARRRATNAGLYPSVSVASSASTNRSSGNSRFSQGDRNYESYSVGFDTAWELDLFGGIRRSTEAALADQQVAEEDLRNTLVSLSAEIALNYIDLRSFQERLDIAESNLKAQQETLDFVRSREEAGLVEDLEVNRAIENVENTRAEIPSLRTSYVAARNRLTTLLGMTPGQLDSRLKSSRPLPKVPTRIGVGIPADTLRRRPDVQAAERSLAAETARVGVAIAELYPKFALNGSIGVESLAASGLFKSGSDTFGLGPSASWNIFQAGAIRRNIEAQTEVQEQALLSYEATILVALEEVENALTALANEQVRAQALSKSADATAKAASIARSQYEDGGLTSFLDVLDAERSRLTAQNNLAISRATIVSNLVRLYRTLGGGW